MQKVEFYMSETDNRLSLYTFVDNKRILTIEKEKKNESCAIILQMNTPPTDYRNASLVKLDFIDFQKIASPMLKHIQGRLKKYFDEFEEMFLTGKKKKKKK